MDEINKIPPVTRSLVGATCLVSLPTMLKLVSPITAFFFGPPGLSFIFDLFFLFRHAQELELNYFHRRTADMAWSLVIMGAVILAANYPLRSSVLHSPLNHALTYLWARANPHGSTSLFGFVTIPAKFLPYAMLALDLLQGGPDALILGATGLVGAHAYFLLHDIMPASNGGRGPRYLPATPAFLKRLLPDSRDPTAPPPATEEHGAVRRTGYGGIAFAPRGRAFGDGGAAAAPATGGQALGSGGSGSSGGGLFGMFRRGGATASTGTSGPSSSGPDREAMLRAAEARLRAQRENSIAGRNAGAARAASQAAASDAARAREARAGRSDLGGRESSTSALRESSSTSTTARRAGAGGSSSFATMARAPDANESASGSGGSVAEERRKAPQPAQEEEERKPPGANSTGGGVFSGTGHRLGD
ncbi:DER1-domain-containing protein [Tilletiopsis washingtonensis]|uniref:Derlin n=1 Tax=Tilletiopsis washingtonensis TaxID=58919 RepID=A0A316ZHU3_9BASI|nr:DER1-domain-containing protein [Tilletiopsis washingtonensis]PWO01331.1 DER1-domain-containing protein [Tilletiopsis washingtonensis]